MFYTNRNHSILYRTLSDTKAKMLKEWSPWFVFRLDQTRGSRPMATQPKGRRPEGCFKALQLIETAFLSSHGTIDGIAK